MAVTADAASRATAATAALHRGPARRMASAAGTVVSVVVAIVGALTLVFALATHFVPDGGAFTVAGHPLFIVLSGSMTPVIDTGDLVIDERVSSTQAAHLRAGQIITFHRGSGATPITHRIVAVTSSAGSVAYTTKGDANNAADRSPVPSTQIVGLFDFKIPMGGRIIAGLRQPLTLGLLLGAPALWLLSGFLFAWARELDEKAETDPPAGKKTEGRAP